MTNSTLQDPVPGGRNTGERRSRLAYLVSHPIQYQAPLLRYLASDPNIDLTVFFLSDFSLRSFQDPGFKAEVTWDVPLVEGYRHEFLPAIGKRGLVTAVKPLSYGLTGLLRAGKFDFLWMHGYAHPVNLRAMAIAKSLGIKVLVRAESQMKSAEGTGFKRRIKEAAIRRLFTGIDGFLTIGALNKEYYRHYGVPESKLFSMPYAVDNDFFQAKISLARPRREELRKELGLHPGRPIILYASKFIARKRAMDLLEGYARLSPDGKEEPKPYLLFIGEGPEGAALKQRAAELSWPSVRFLGFKNQTELPSYFDLCDVFVLISEREPWGLIVNEVMNAGKPVIVSDEVGCAADLVRDGQNGFVIRTGDVEALADRLRVLVEDADLAHRMGNNSREIVNAWGYREDLAGLLDALETIGCKSCA